MNKKEKIIGILGGMGPEAGVMMQRYINQSAKAILHTKHDADFPDVLHFSMPKHLPDRTNFLIGLEAENPAIEAAKQALFLAHIGQQLGKDVIACVACDTFHASAIWQLFCKNIQACDNLTMVHMVDETIQELKDFLAPPAKIAIFGTIGGLKEKIYESRLVPLGYEITPLTFHQQQDIHKAIYDPHNGLKAHSMATDFAIKLVENVTASLKEQNVQKIILGCTELSLIISSTHDELFLDPMMTVANRLVHLYAE
ncbi:MAG: amino acid racemase [Alphaproteobacteria bacterium]|nr:amino acid racemase [Alphaproteobacteria bacterium]